MHIQLRFFASVRETLGVSTDSIDVPSDVTTVSGVRALLVARGGLWAEALGAERPLRMALDHVMCAPDAVLRQECEVAFFPPVTGG